MLHVGLFWLSPTLYADPRLSLHKYLRTSLYPATVIGHRAFYRLSIHSVSFLVSPKIQFVVRDLSIFGTTLFTVFFERVHSAYGSIRLPWRFVKIYIYIYPLEPREGHNWIGNQSPWSGSSDPFHRPAHSVAACLLRLPPFSWTFRWNPFFIAWCSLVVVSSPAFYVYRTSSAVWVLMFFRYSAFLYLIIFFICSVSPVCPFLPLLFASGLRSENGLFFPLSHPCCFDLLFTHCVTNVTHSLGLGLRVFCPVRPVSLPFSPGSVPTLFYSTIYLHFNIF